MIGTTYCKYRNGTRTKLLPDNIINCVEENMKDLKEIIGMQQLQHVSGRKHITSTDRWKCCFSRIFDFADFRNFC